MLRLILSIGIINCFLIHMVPGQSWEVDQGLMEFTYQDIPGPPPAGPLISKWQVGVGNSYSYPDFFSIGKYKFVLDYIIKEPALVINDTSLFVGVGIDFPKGKVHVNHSNTFGAQRAAMQIGPFSGSGRGYLTVNKPTADNNSNIALFRDNGASSVAINKHSATYQLKVYGDIDANNLFMVSDARFKTNISEISGALTDLRKIKPRYYTFKSEVQSGRNLPSGPQFGLLAQELREVYPHLVKESRDPETVGDESPAYYSVNYLGLIPVLIAANQELDHKYHQLQQQNQMLEERLMQLELAWEKSGDQSP
ncbi:MAG: tail fiber domain-containing protein [Saprospiraceae bacterium]|nr:tail fiber domain-containing protein [Saprospiraceae bacterium]